MKSKDQVVGYLRKILETENAMRDGYESLAGAVADRDTRTLLHTLRLEEESHAKMIRGLIEVFEK